MLVINPLKPFYVDRTKKIIRMGNFKNSAKEIEYEDDNFVKLFENVKEPISKGELIKRTQNDTGLSKEDIETAIEYLISEQIIVNHESYKQLFNGKLNRQNLFFSMTNGNIKNWSLVKQPNILILGLGGVGSNVSIILSRAGFNNFTLVDCDKVEESNLMRQYPYDIKDIGKYKTNALKEKINNNENKIEILNKMIVDEDDIEKQIYNADFVLCTLDKPSRIIRRLVNNLCIKYSKPVIFSGFAEHVAMIGPFVKPKKSACLKCIEQDMQEEPLYNVKNTPSYGPLCLLISSIVANEIINYYYQFNQNNLIGKTLMIDILTYNHKIIKWHKKKDCEVCGNDSK